MMVKHLFWRCTLCAGFINFYFVRNQWKDLQGVPQSTIAVLILHQEKGQTTRNQTNVDVHVDGQQGDKLHPLPPQVNRSQHFIEQIQRKIHLPNNTILSFWWDHASLHVVCNLIPRLRWYSEIFRGGFLEYRCCKIYSGHLRGYALQAILFSGRLRPRSCLAICSLGVSWQKLFGNSKVSWNGCWLSVQILHVYKRIGRTVAL